METREEIVEKKPSVSKDGSIISKKVDKKGDTTTTITEVTKGGITSITTEVTKGNKVVKKTEDITEISAVIEKDETETGVAKEDTTPSSTKKTKVTNQDGSITDTTVSTKGKTTTIFQTVIRGDEKRTIVKVKEENKPVETREEIVEKKPSVSKDGSIISKKVDKKGDTTTTITEVTKGGITSITTEVTKGNKVVKKTEDITEISAVIEKDGTAKRTTVKKHGDTKTTVTEVTKDGKMYKTTEVTKGDKPVEKTEESTEKSTVVEKDGTSTTTTVTKKGDTTTKVTEVTKGDTTTTTTAISKDGKTITRVKTKSAHTETGGIKLQHVTEECQCDTVPHCQVDEELITVAVKGRCCPKLQCEKKRRTCGLVSRETFVKRKSCQSKVKLPGCGGLCASSYQYSSDGGWRSACGCCKPTQFRSHSVLLRCGDGSVVTETLSVPTVCSCAACK
ncbi:hypothetical protein AAFF_G00406420 [Aldrovandia affinis]|uniref:CTCK domain-containing protein n=1 Tax=Aldrovandia affinis TaxID=143900 RepID=A0AAD7WK70_9TELE|nr:hypothetical protein AAFF_G00406420 [Aldrovandia affinis]